MALHTARDTHGQDAVSFRLPLSRIEIQKWCRAFLPWMFRTEPGTTASERLALADGGVIPNIQTIGDRFRHNSSDTFKDLRGLFSKKVLAHHDQAVSHLFETKLFRHSDLLSFWALALHTVHRERWTEAASLLADLAADMRTILWRIPGGPAAIDAFLAFIRPPRGPAIAGVGADQGAGRTDQEGDSQNCCNC